MFFLIAGSILFPYAYNAVVPGTREKPLESYFSLGSIDKYGGEIRYVQGGYDVGRTAMLKYVWRTINASALTLLLGEGLGSWAESNTLGSMGNGIRNSKYGARTGASLVVILGESGLLGMVAVSGFILWVVITFCV